MRACGSVQHAYMVASFRDATVTNKSRERLSGDASSLPVLQRPGFRLRGPDETSAKPLVHLWPGCVAGRVIFVSQRPVSMQYPSAGAGPRSARRSPNCRSLTSREVRARGASQDRTPHAQFDGVSSACAPAGRPRAPGRGQGAVRRVTRFHGTRLTVSTSCWLWSSGEFKSTLEPDLLRWTTFRRSPWVWGPPIPRGAAQVLRRRWRARCSVTLSTRSLSSRDTLALASYSLSTKSPCCCPPRSPVRRVAARLSSSGASPQRSLRPPQPEAASASLTSQKTQRGPPRRDSLSRRSAVRAGDALASRGDRKTAACRARPARSLESSQST